MDNQVTDLPTLKKVNQQNPNVRNVTDYLEISFVKKGFLTIFQHCKISSDT